MAVKGKTDKLLASNISEPNKQINKRKSRLLDYRNIKTFRETREPKILLDDISREKSI